MQNAKWRYLLRKFFRTFIMISSPLATPSFCIFHFKFCIHILSAWEYPVAVYFRGWRYGDQIYGSELQGGHLRQRRQKAWFCKRRPGGTAGGEDRGHRGPRSCQDLRNAWQAGRLCDTLGLHLQNRAGYYSCGHQARPASHPPSPTWGIFLEKTRIFPQKTLAISNCFIYNNSAWANCAHSTTHHTPGDRTPKCLRTGSAR